MSVTGSTNIASLATTSPLAALSELDDPTAISAPPGMCRDQQVKKLKCCLEDLVVEQDYCCFVM